MKKMMKYGILSAVIILVIALTGCSKKTINISDYVKVEFEGYDTIGTAKWSIDYDRLIEENKKEFKLSAKSSDDDIEDRIDDVKSCIRGEFDVDSNLTNGDEVVLKLKIDSEELAEISKGAEFEGKKITTTVSGLKGYDDYDLFADITVEILGKDGNGYANIIYGDNVLTGINYYLDKDYYLSNGDTVTVYATTYYADSVEEYMATLFKKPIALEKTITVDSLGGYVNSFDQIDQATLDKLATPVEDAIRANYTLSDEKLVSMKLLGNYFAKQTQDYYYTDNILYYIYEVQGENDVAKFTYYFCGSYENLMIDGNGNITSESDLELPYYAYIEILDEYAYEGYFTFDRLYEDTIWYVEHDYYDVFDNVPDIKNDVRKVEYTIFKDCEEYDLFEGVEVTFEGVDGSGDAYFTVNNSVYKDFNYDIDYSFSESYDLKNGDVITLYATAYYYYNKPVEEIMGEAGYKPITTYMEFTVSGLNALVSSIDELDDDMLEQLDVIAQDIIKEDLAWSSSEKVNSLKLLGNYFLSEPIESYYYGNLFYNVYEGEYENSFAKVTFYTYVRFTELNVNDDGVIDYRFTDIPECHYDMPYGGQGGGYDDEWGKGDYDGFFGGYEDEYTFIDGYGIEIVDPKNPYNTKLISGFGTYSELYEAVEYDEGDYYKSFVNTVKNPPKGTDWQITYK